MRPNDILDYELGQVNVLVFVDFLDRFSVLSRSLLTHFLCFSTSTNHFTALKNQGSSFRLSNTHNRSCKSLRFIFNIFTSKSY